MYSSCTRPNPAKKIEDGERNMKETQEIVQCTKHYSILRKLIDGSIAPYYQKADHSTIQPRHGSFHPLRYLAFISLLACQLSIDFIFASPWFVVRGPLTIYREFPYITTLIGGSFNSCPLSIWAGDSCDFPASEIHDSSFESSIFHHCFDSSGNTAVNSFSEKLK